MDKSQLRIVESGWGAYYSPEESDLTYYALGRDDWAPIAVVCAYMIDPNWVTASLAHLCDLPANAAWAVSWREANAAPLGTFVKALEDREDAPIHGGPVCMFPVELGQCFQVMDQTCTPRVGHGSLVSSPGLSSYRSLPRTGELAALRSPLRREFFAVAVHWFQHRAIEVDRDRLEVRVPGYEALYHVSRFDPW